MLSSEIKESFLTLVRLGIGQDSLSPVNTTDWKSLKALAEKHGLSAVVLDGLDKVSGLSMPVTMKLEWIGEALQNFEQRYVAYENAIASLAAFYEQHKFKMMVLKGYGLSLNYPKPNHRPCGDIDIWLFGMQKEADEALLQALGPKFKIDAAHHHHTVFEWEGFSVENHYDFLNVHHHKSNVEMEAILKELGLDDRNSVEVNGSQVYLPSADLHALFMLRHAMSNFASTGFNLRQLLDWGFFAQKHGSEIDWNWLDAQLEHFGMKKLYDIFNAICVGDLGLEVKIFQKVQFDPQLKDRVLNDILSPEFNEKEKGNFFSRAIFKYRRWKANAWKHELCFSESMWSAFWSGVWGHLLKPSSI